jgi:hypothetical protein
MLRTNDGCAAVVCCIWLFAVMPASADELPPASAVVQSRALNAMVRNGESRGWEQTRRLFVKCGTNEMAFEVPFRMRVDMADDKITLVASDAAFYLTFRVRVPAPGSVANPDAERSRLLNEYANAKITDQYRAATPEHSGRSYELRWTPAGVSERLVRVAFIPTDAGTIELTLVAESAKPADGVFAFNSILTTMRKAQNGKFEFVRTTDAS